MNTDVGRRRFEGESMAEHKPWIVADDLTFGYGPNSIFEHLSFRVDASMVALQGPSGSGKTTLLKLINQDLHPVSGKVAYAGSSSILILQDDSLLPWLSGTANIRISRTFDPGNIHDSRILALMADFADKRAYEMSFGQRRYLEIVRALGTYSDVLLLDEPLNFLDTERRAVVIGELLRQSERRRIMASTHYIEDFDGAPVGRLQLIGSGPFREVVVV